MTAALQLVELGDAAQVDLLEEYRYVTGELKKLTERQEELKIELLKLLRDADGASIGGALVARRIAPTGYEKLNPDLVEKRFPDVYQRCLKWVQPKPYIRLTNA